MEIKSLNNSDMIKDNYLLSMIYSRLGLRVQKREHVITACSVKDSIKSSFIPVIRKLNIGDAIQNLAI